MLSVKKVRLYIAKKKLKLYVFNQENGTIHFSTDWGFYKYYYSVQILGFVSIISLLFVNFVGDRPGELLD